MALSLSHDLMLKLWPNRTNPDGDTLFSQPLLCENSLFPSSPSHTKSKLSAPGLLQHLKHLLDCNFFEGQVPNPLP